MDPASLIVGALVTGILSGVSRSAEEFVNDSYRELKSALLRRYATRDEPHLENAVQWLEAEPTAPTSQRALAYELHRVGADRDPYLLDLAGRLRSVIENPVLDRDQLLPAPLERAQRQAGVQAIGTVLHRHVDTVLDIRNRYPVDDADLLSGTGTGGPLPDTVRDELAHLHGQIRRIIEEIAHRIEANKHQQTEEAIRTLPMSYKDRQRANDLVQADKQIHVSYQALRTLVEYFSELNENLLDSINRERSAARMANLILGNAITVYELTQFVLDYIDRFRLHGLDDVQRLHSEARQRLDGWRAEQQALAEEANAPGIRPEMRDDILARIRGRDTAITQLEQEWDAYLTEIGSARSAIGEVVEMVPALKLMRNDARIQIGVMQEVAILRFLRSNADALKGTISTLQGFRLAALTSSQVCRLVGVEHRRV